MASYIKTGPQIADLDIQCPSSFAGITGKKGSDMTFESREELLAKVGFLAVLTILILGAGNTEALSQLTSLLP